MTTNRPQETLTRTVALRIPALAEGAYTGSGCCVVPADQAIRDELESWPGVVEVDLDVASGMATVHLHGDSPDVSDLVETVEALGYQAEMITEPPQSEEGGERHDPIHDFPRRTLLRRV